MIGLTYIIQPVITRGRQHRRNTRNMCRFVRGRSSLARYQGTTEPISGVSPVPHLSDTLQLFAFYGSGVSHAINRRDRTTTRSLPRTKFVLADVVDRSAGPSRKGIACLRVLYLATQLRSVAFRLVSTRLTASRV